MTRRRWSSCSWEQIYLEPPSKEGADGLAGKNGIKVRRRAMLESIKAFGIIAKETTNSGLSYMGEKIDEILNKKEPQNAN